jgi:hypothetical protein
MHRVCLFMALVAALAPAAPAHAAGKYDGWTGQDCVNMGKHRPLRQVRRAGDQGGLHVQLHPGGDELHRHRQGRDGGSESRRDGAARPAGANARAAYDPAAQAPRGDRQAKGTSEGEG